MLVWITENTALLNTIASWVMVAIWIVYLQVFLRSFRRQTLPKIVINRAAGSNLGASCFVSNMSSEAIYIESVIVTIATETNSLSSIVTDFEEPSEENKGADPKLRTYQGTLASAQYISIGTFDYLIGSVARRNGHDVESLQRSSEDLSVEITIAADYASERLLFGARRKFRAQWKEPHWRLLPEAHDTEQLRTSRGRKEIYKILADLA